MILKAMEQYGKIFPVKRHKTYRDFTVHCKQIIFWFNTKDHSTHVIIEEEDEADILGDS